MRAMILAAGRGERLRPLTDDTPKPLLEIGGRPLVEYCLDRLVAAGFRDIVINQGHRGDRLRAALGDGERWGITIHWSLEPPEALETGGGIVQALPLLGTTPFLTVNGDLWTDFPFAELRAVKCDWAHLVLVPNPPHHPTGDFALVGARIRNDGEPRHTFGGIAVYHPRLFAGCAPGRYSVVPLLRRAIDQHTVTGQLYRGEWLDVGTPARLEAVRAQAKVRPSRTSA